MALVDIDLLRAHVRADDLDGDGAVLAHYLAAAEEAVLQWTNRTADELAAMNGGTFPATVQQAVLLLAGQWYDQREGVSGTAMQEVPLGISALLKPWRRLDAQPWQQ